MKKKKHPVQEPESKEPEYFPSASWGDMTGLIPADTEQDGAGRSYSDIYPYRADSKE